MEISRASPSFHKSPWLSSIPASTTSYREIQSASTERVSVEALCDHWMLLARMHHKHSRNFLLQFEYKVPQPNGFRLRHFGTIWLICFLWVFLSCFLCVPELRLYCCKNDAKICMQHSMHGSGLTECCLVACLLLWGMHSQTSKAARCAKRGIWSCG